MTNHNDSSRLHGSAERFAECGWSLSRRLMRQQGLAHSLGAGGPTTHL